MNCRLLSQGGEIIDKKGSEFVGSLTCAILYKICLLSDHNHEKIVAKTKLVLFLAGLEPATFRVLGGRDNHYTTETPC